MNQPVTLGSRRADAAQPAAAAGHRARDHRRQGVAKLTMDGRARTGFLIERREIARAALDGREPVPAGPQTPMSRTHIRSLLGQMCLGATDLDVLATQLTAALGGPLLLCLSSATLTQTAPQVAERLGRGWADLVQRACARTGRPAERQDSSAIGRQRAT